jgi:hypothetical protein
MPPQEADPLATIDYEPEFKHTDWIDNVTRVKAGGEDGFNRHFHDIEDEFQKLADTVTAIREKLDQLGQTPAPKDVTTTFAPTLVALGTTPWAHVYGTATKPGGATAATGMMSITLPNGATLKSLRVIGRNSGAGALAIGLRRQALPATSGSELIVGIPGTGGAGGLFDTPKDAPAGDLSRVNTSLYRYYLTAELDSAAAADTVQVTAIQVTYTAA